ncbi:MAG: hypothetical protein K2X01_08460 [Cyanobacteria bacterium]|nr:hypothetical protein [Cyanobacteriota bacterium]
MPQLPIMPFIVLFLLLLPVKLPSKSLLKLAFFLWATGGIVLCAFGLSRLSDDPTFVLQSANGLLTLGLVAVIGFFKGKFILSKTSQKNIDRLLAFTEPVKPIQVYSIRSWIVIGVMVLISLSLTWFSAPLFWRGVVNLAVGLALIVSSFCYLHAGEKAKLGDSANLAV